MAFCNSLRRAPIYLVAMVAGLLVSGCGASLSAAHQEILQNAEADLACGSADLQFTKDEPFEKHVAGCGRTARYRQRCITADRKAYQYSSSYYGNQECKWTFAGKSEENKPSAFVAPETTVTEDSETEVITEGKTKNEAEGPQEQE